MGVVRFAIKAWAAYAPGLRTPSEWQAWARSPWLPCGEPDARLEAMPPMQRRRLSPLGRAATQVAWECHTPAAHTPVVFASGYGDAARCLQLLKAFALSGTASPTEFTFSVHNAIGAMYSISRADQAAYTTIAAGAASAAAGVIEACGLLADGASEVLLVAYEAPLPAEYQQFHREPAATWAWAWRLALPEAHESHFRLAWTGASDHAPSDLPFGLGALRFALSNQRVAQLQAEHRLWTWSRHA
jgi:hypothetical protein